MLLDQQQLAGSQQNYPSKRRLTLDDSFFAAFSSSLKLAADKALMDTLESKLRTRQQNSIASTARLANDFCIRSGKLQHLPEFVRNRTHKAWVPSG